MANTKNNIAVGDMKAPALLASDETLRNGVDQARSIDGESAKKAAKMTTLGNMSLIVKASNLKNNAATSCRQILWFSFFFDGTGNNLFVDKDLSKHSNVAKLSLVHCRNDPVKGIYSIYIPGVGTYFPEIQDNGGSTLGLGCGAMGEKRLNRALTEFDKFIAHHLADANAVSAIICEINIAVFGFSRGAALARAFVNMFLEQRCKLKDGRFTFKSGGWPVRIRFMGLFDTVASVGLPLSFNNTNTAASAMLGPKAMMLARQMMYRNTLPAILAFGEGGVAGADPAPGPADGHKDWGARLEINEHVEEVRHFVAAHEMRNSFPVDSISVWRNGKITKPARFYETVYPGVHSDVGGSYAPQEGGKSKKGNDKFGVIPLLHMFEHALSCGVPLLPSNLWTQRVREDFEIDPAVLTIYNEYQNNLDASSSLGHLINSHMKLYYQWRFRVIRLKASGDNSEDMRVAESTRNFSTAALPVDQQLTKLAFVEQIASARVDLLKQRIAEQNGHGWEGQNESASNVSLKGELVEATEKHQTARRNLLSMQSKKDALPNMTEFADLRDIYDRQLVEDVRSIFNAITKKSDKNKARSDLRPHYRILLDAYEAEFLQKKGLNNQSVIHFFDEYIHDSLAGFGKDATLPSDPRVVYLGGDQKFAYANLDVGTQGRDIA